MKAAEVLERLEKAREIISTFPADIDILQVTVDGVPVAPEDKDHCIFIAGGQWDRLIEAHAIGPEKPRLPHGNSEDYDKYSIMVGGFELLELVRKGGGTP